MVDRFGRNIDYLRVSVTDRCNLRCSYCMPADATFVPDEDRLTFDEIVEVVRLAVRHGVRKVRLTGGEPLLRPDVERLVGMLSRIEGIRDLAMSTNGTLLADHAVALAAAGLGRVNVSIDAVRPEHYAERTGGGDVRRALSGIDAAVAAGLTPVKLNCVVRESSAEPDARDVQTFARRHGLQVRFIRQMDLATGSFGVVEGGSGGDCTQCTRLRLLSNGILKPCLFSDLAFSVRRLGAARAIEQAINHKPQRGTRCTDTWMYAIGG